MIVSTIDASQRFDPPGTAPPPPPPPVSETPPVYWSVQRELWENRSIDMAPVPVAAVMQFGFLISTMTLRSRMRALLALVPAKQRATLEVPYDMAAGLIVATAFIVGVFCCRDALHGERRDR